MREAEQREPDHAGIMRRRRAAPLRRGAFDDEQGAGAEQQREKTAHLGIDEHEIERTCPKVGGRGGDARRRGCTQTRRTACWGRGWYYLEISGGSSIR